MLRKYLGTLPAMALSIGVLAGGLWLNSHAHRTTPNVNSPVATPAQTSELEILLAKAAKAREGEPKGKGIEVSVAYVGVETELYRTIVASKENGLPESPTSLQRARIWENDAHRRFMNPGKSCSPHEWVRELRNKKEINVKQWEALLKFGNVKCATWSVVCLWIRAEGVRPATKLDLRMDRMRFPTSWAAFDMYDLLLLSYGPDDERRGGIPPPNGSKTDIVTITLGDLAPGDSVLVPLYVTERLIATSAGNLDPDFRARDVIYLPREFSWKDTVTGLEKKLFTDDLLAEPILVSSSTKFGGMTGP